MGGEEGEQVELALGQRDLLAVEEDPARRRLDPQRPELDRRRALARRDGRSDPPQHRFDSRDQLLGENGLTT